MVTSSKPRPRKLKKPKEKDLKTIASKINFDTNRLLMSVYIQQESFDLGFDPEGYIDKIEDLIKARFHNNQKRKQAQLDQKFREAILEIWPDCSGSKEIKAKITLHSHYSDNPVIGGPSGDSHWETLDYLYCNSCGRVYYTDKVPELEARMRSGEFIA